MRGSGSRSDRHSLVLPPVFLFDHLGYPLLCQFLAGKAVSVSVLHSMICSWWPAQAWLGKRVDMMMYITLVTNVSRLATWCLISASSDSTFSSLTCQMWVNERNIGEYILGAAGGSALETAPCDVLTRANFAFLLGVMQTDLLKRERLPSSWVETEFLSMTKRTRWVTIALAWVCFTLALGKVKIQGYENQCCACR